jgi:hypothetical protein
MPRPPIHAGRRAAIATLAALPALAVAPGARAQAFPSRPVKIVVPHAPGGNSDAFARIVAQRLSERLVRPMADRRDGESKAVLAVPRCNRRNVGPLS